MGYDQQHLAGRETINGGNRRIRALDHDFRASVGDRVFFGEAATDIGAKSRTVLAAQADWLKRNGSLAIVIEGHADDRGSAGVNRELAAKRAEAVRDRLIEEGVQADRIQVRVLGREAPIAPCQDAGCAAQNRRAVTVIMDRGGAINQARSVDGPFMAADGPGAWELSTTGGCPRQAVLSRSIDNGAIREACTFDEFRVATEVPLPVRATVLTAARWQVTSAEQGRVGQTDEGSRA